jgi:hypothetical protein
MQSKNLEFVIAQAQDERQKHPLALAVAAAIEVGVVVPSILRSKLKGAGFKVVEDATTPAEYGFGTLAVLKRTLVEAKDGKLLAMGAAGTQDEALLHAMLGWFRENALPESEVPEGLPLKPKK